MRKAAIKKPVKVKDDPAAKSKFKLVQDDIDINDEDVLAKLGLTPGQREECRRMIVEAAAAVARVPKAVNPGEEKRKQDDLIAKLKNARTAASEVDPGLAEYLSIDSLLKEVNRMVRESEALRRELEIKSSGGSRHEAARKTEAASWAFHIMLRFRLGLPSTSDDGIFLELTGDLYRLATGKQAVKFEDACLPMVNLLGARTERDELREQFQALKALPTSSWPSILQSILVALTARHSARSSRADTGR